MTRQSQPRGLGEVDRPSTAQVLRQERDRPPGVTASLMSIDSGGYRFRFHSIRGLI